MIKAVLDTNVIISGIVFGGKPRQVLESAFRGSTQIYISEPIINELKGVLQRPRFYLTSEIIEIIISELIAIAEWVEPKEHINVIKSDPDDNIFLECALSSESEYIVSGDDHLLELNKWKGINIITPDKYIEELEKRIK
jgi:putative PIN family toxin of toxin-antitoxin system